MLGRRSLNPNLVPIDSELEQTLSHLRTRAQQPPLAEAVVNVEEPKTLKAYFTPTAYMSPSCIRLPATTAGQYEIKSSTISILPVFHGLSNEDPYKHLDDFLEICTTFKLQNLNEEAIKLCLFPFSLKDKAKHWLNSSTRDTITTWAQLQEEFLKKYFPIGKTNLYRRALTTFTQLDNEQFHETWERLKDLLRKCPHHAVPRWQLVQTFYDGLTSRNRQMIHAACGCTFMLKNEDEAWNLFKNLSDNSLHHASSGHPNTSASTTPEAGGIYELNSSLDVSKKVDVLTKMIEQLMTVRLPSTPPPTVLPPQQPTVCALCSSPSHHIVEYQLAPQFPEFVQEHVKAMQTYTSAWQNPPNLAWKPQAPNNPYTQPPVSQFLNYQPNFMPPQSQPQ